MYRILILSIVYNEKKENLYNDLVEALADKGHYITVVTSNSNRSFNNKYRQIGFKENIVGNANLITKGFNTLFIGKKFKQVIKKELISEHFDLILYATPPITLNSAIKFSKKTFKARSFLMLKDIFPQNAVDLKMMSKMNPIYWYFRLQEKRLYRISDKIGCMSKGNIQYILSHNPDLPDSKVGLFPNTIKVQECNNTVISKKTQTTFLFGGNLGKPQNIIGLLKVIDCLQNYDKARFVIIGSGSEKNKVLEYKDLPNLEFYDYLPREQYNEKLKNADVGIISLDPRFTIPNFPSKLPSYMNMKKPVLAITDTCTDIRNIIDEADCGWWVNAEKIDQIVKTIQNICEDKNQISIKGENGYLYMTQNFDVEKSVSILEDFISDAI